MLQCLGRHRTSFPRAREEQDRLRLAVALHHVWFLWPPVVTQTIDTNTDHNCNRTTNLDMALGSKSDLDAIMVSVAA